MRMASPHAKPCGWAAEWLRKVATCTPAPRMRTVIACPTQTAFRVALPVYHPTKQTCLCGITGRETTHRNARSVPDFSDV